MNPSGPTSAGSCNPSLDRGMSALDPEGAENASLKVTALGGHYELGVEARHEHLRGAAAFDELAEAI